ncbi:MAG: hypothetical protein QOF48_803 [Verrucomicrobiota bacterium]|jgi:hypothetical protein
MKSIVEIYTDAIDENALENDRIPQTEQSPDELFFGQVR